MFGRRWFRYAGLLLAIVVLAIGWKFGSHWWRQSRTAREMAACRELRTQRKWAELAERARVWNQWSPKDADAWLLRALAAKNLGEAAQAAEFLAQIDEASPKYLPSQLARAELLFGVANRPFEGERVSRMILEKEPRATTPHQWLIEFYATTLQKQKFLAQLREAVRVRREPPEAYMFAFSIDAMRLSSAVEVLSRWLEAHPDDEMLLVALALNFVDPVGEPEPAAGSEAVQEVQVDPLERQSREARLRTLLQRFPHNLELLAHHIEWAIAEGDLENVIRLLQDAPAEADSDNRFWRYRGWVQVQAGDLDAAKQSYDQALALAPLDWVTRNRLVTLLRLKNEVEQVEKQQAIVEKARLLQARFKKVRLAEHVTSDIVAEFRDYAELCGDTTFSQAAASTAPSNAGLR